jgi:transcriptional regulator with XRE-family HTH domain
MNGDALRSQRLRLGWSREQLAHTVGVPAARVAAWENDNAPIDCPRALAQVLAQPSHDKPRSAAGRELREPAPEN